MSWYSSLGLTKLDGAPLGEALAGKVVLFVNVASECGYTPQYEGLVALQRELGAGDFTVVGVPCNQFGAQEPGTPEAIAEFCRTAYAVDFPLLHKQDVNGPERSALYAHLVDSAVGAGKPIAWNFEKFLVDRTGAVRARFPSRTKPESATLKTAIAEALAAS